jgi:Mg/Co/Ni transporter MgtE
MKSDYDDAIDAIGQLPDSDVKKLFGDCDADVAKEVAKAKPEDRRETMIDAIAHDYLDDDTNDMPVDDWIKMKLPKMT